MNKPIALMIVGALLLAGSLTYHFMFEVGQTPTAAHHVAQTKPAAVRPLPDILAYIPADTIVFFGGIEPASLHDILRMTNPSQARMQLAKWDQLTSSPNYHTLPPAARMILGLSHEYLRLILNPEQASAALGVPDKFEAAFYTVGLVPVIRLKLNDPAAFSAFVAQAENAVGVQPEKSDNNGVNLRSYGFERPGAKDHNTLKLIIAQYQEYAIITLDTQLAKGHALKTSLGVEKPNKSLKDDQRLVALQRKYGFNPAYLGYIDHREIINGLTRSDTNNFGRMLDELLGDASSNKSKDCGTSTPCKAEPNPDQGDTTPPHDPLSDIRNEACHDDFMSIAEHWPRTVFGYTSLHLDEAPMNLSTRLVVENADAASVKDMESLRGHIPAHLRDNNHLPALGAAIALNMDALIPVLTKAVQEFVQYDYRCQPLKDIQQKMARANPVTALLASSSFLSGLRGISLALMDLDLSTQPGQAGMHVKGIDGILAITARDPRALLSTLSAMPGSPLASLQLPADGSAIPLPPLPMAPPDLTAKAAIKGNHIVVYVGPQSEKIAEQISQDKLEANGVFTMIMDMGRYLGMLIPSGSLKRGGPNQAQLDAIKDMKGTVHMSMDFTDKGIALDSNATMQ